MAWILQSIFLILAFLYLLRRCRRKTSRKLPPSPKGLPIIGHLHLLGNHPHRDLSNLARKHGPIMSFRLGFVPGIIASSPAAAELFLKTHDLSFCSRPSQEAAKFLGYDQNDLIFAPYGEYWRNMRKLITIELLSNMKLNQFKDMRTKEMNAFVNSLKQVKGTVDLTRKVSGLIGDINFLMVFGRKFADDDLGNDTRGFRDVIHEVVDLGSRFNVADYFPLIGVFDLQGMNRRMKSLAKIFDGFLEKIIDDHIQCRFNDNSEEKKIRVSDFVDTMIGIMESGEANFQFDRRHVKAVLLDLMIAGLDTSSTTIDWTLSELIKNPTKMKKLQNELDSVFGINNTVQESNLDQLIYLNCIIKETLRLHPIGPLLLPHESIEDCTVNGFFIPKKSRILVNIWAIGMDPNVWPDPESFNPERFIGNDIDLKGKNFELIPFGSGRRGCPGMQLGLTLVRFVVAQMVHCFDWELPDGLDPSELDMTEQVGLAVARSKPLMVIPTYRLNV